jgi:hypothetical protein
VVIVLVADAEAPIEERQPAAWGIRRITWRSLASHGSCVRLEQHVDHYEREVDVCCKITSRAGSSSAVRARA